MMTRLAAFCVAIWLAILPASLEAKRELQCKPLGLDKPALMVLRAKKFGIADQAERQNFAIELLNCVGNPDPDLRDKVAYEGFSAMLRNKQLDVKTIAIVRERLIKALQQDSYGVDPSFEKPFAALILSEVARADRIDAIFSDAERQEIVDGASAYMSSISDYRGFDESDGWRHGVAHTADIFLQLSLNEQIGADHLRSMMDAIKSQITPAGHFYIYGEPRRLARPILFSASRGLIEDQEWSDWFAKLADPAPLANWGEAYQSQIGLARLHNLRAFASFIYLNASLSQNPSVKALVEPSLDLLKKLP